MVINCYEVKSILLYLLKILLRNSCQTNSFKLSKIEIFETGLITTIG